MGSSEELVRATACDIVERLRKNDITPHDLLDALETRIQKVDGQVNALPTLCFDRARAHADRLMKKPASERGLLAGMPVPIKDLTDVAGVLTTQGSPIFKDSIATKSNIVVENLEANGAVIYAKSNTPEFGAGAQTFNEVFGATLNPWNLSRSASDHPVALRPRSQPARRGSPMAPMWADRCAIRPASAAWSACGLASAGSRIPKLRRSTGRSAPTDPWPATWKISR